jgi:hypothetical protein
MRRISLAGSCEQVSGATVEVKVRARVRARARVRLFFVKFATAQNNSRNDGLNKSRGRRIIYWV